MRAILHIGTNKTGTSALQGFLHHNPQLLSENGILYPRTGRGSDAEHHTLAETLYTSPDRVYEFRYRLLKEARGYDTLILSSEAFHTYPPEPLAQLLHGIPTTVVAFLRPHFQYLSSWYREGIKSRNTFETFPQFVHSNAKPYSSWLQSWADYFDTTVYVYDRSKFEHNSIVHEFFSKLDLWICQYPHIPEENPSISGNLLYLKREVNQFITEDQAHLLIPEILELATLNPSFTAPMSIDADTASYITRMSEPDVQQIAEAFKIDIADTYDPNRGVPIPNLATLRADYDAVYHYSQARKFQFSNLIEKLYLP